MKSTVSTARILILRTTELFTKIPLSLDLLQKVRVGAVFGVYVDHITFKRDSSLHAVSFEVPQGLVSHIRELFVNSKAMVLDKVLNFSTLLQLPKLLNQSQGLLNYLKSKPASFHYCPRGHLFLEACLSQSPLILLFWFVPVSPHTYLGNGTSLATPSNHHCYQCFLWEVTGTSAAKTLLQKWEGAFYFLVFGFPIEGLQSNPSSSNNLTRSSPSQVFFPLLRHWY